MTISPKVFPIIIIVLMTCAAVVCLWHCQHKKALYWGAAAALNWAVL